MMVDQKLQTAAGQGEERAAVFISYAREDDKFALRLDESLRLKGVDVRGDWMLVRGAGYEEQLRLFILESDALVFVITPASAGSPACRQEVELAVAMKKRILPVVHRDCDEEALHPALRSPQWTFMRDSDDFVEGMQGLIEAVKTDFELLPEHRRLLAAAETWQRNGRQKSYLLRKEGLRKAEVWLTQTSFHPNKLPKPTPLQSEYILASRHARTKGARVAFVVVAAIALTMTLLSIVALAQRSIAQRNELRATDNEQRALKNEQEANRQREQAVANAEEARYQAGVAKTNEEEAKRQQQAAEESAAEARRQKGIAVANAEEALNRLTRINESNGVQRLDQQDYPGAAVWFGEAMRLKPGGREEARLRLEALLGEYPRVQQAFFGDAPILSAAYSSDGRRVVTTHADRTARVWDAETGAPITPPLKHEGKVSAAVFSPDGRDLATVSYLSAEEQEKAWLASLPRDMENEPLMKDEEALHEFSEKLEEASKEEAKRLLEEHPRLKFLFDYLYEHADLSYLTVWDVETGRARTERLKEEFTVEHAEYSRDGRRLLLWGKGARVWSVDEQRDLSPLGKVVRKSEQEINAALSPDGSRYAVFLVSETVPVIDAATSETLFTVDVGEKDPKAVGGNYVDTAVFSPDGALLAMSETKDRIRVLDAKTGALVTGFVGIPTGASLLAFSPDGRLLFASSQSAGSATFQLWEAKTGKPLTNEQPVKAPVDAVAFSPDGKRLLTTLRERFSGRPETVVWRIPAPAPNGLPTDINALGPPLVDTDSVGWHPSGQRIVTIGPGAVARTWRVGDNPVLVPTASYAGFHGLFTAEPEAGSVQVRDSDRRPVGPPIRAAGERVNAVVSSDGRLVIIEQETDKGTTMRAWNVATGRPVTPNIEAYLPKSLELSRDGKRVLMMWNILEKGWARVWDARTGAEVGAGIDLDDNMRSAHLDPTGRRVVTAHADGSVFVWDAATGKKIGPRITHPFRAEEALFSLDGKLILSAGGPLVGENIRVWDALTGQPKTPPMIHAGLEYVAFSPDGRFVVSDGDEKVRLWLAETGVPASPPIAGQRARWHTLEQRLWIEPVQSPGQAQGTPLVWDLRPAGQSAESLALTAEFTAGRRVNQAGALAELDTQTLRRIWETLKRHGR